MAWIDKTIVTGCSLGIGDFLSAVPVVNELPRNSNRVTMVDTLTNLELAELFAIENKHVRLVGFVAEGS